MATIKDNKADIAVIGAGAIGALAAGYLKLQGERVSLVARSEQVEAIKKKGLEISGARGDFKIQIDVYADLNFTPGLLILATKTQDIEAALKNIPEFIRNTTILTTQNGVRADETVAKYAPPQNIVSSIVMFGATYLEPGKVVHNFEGSWIIGKAFGNNDEKTKEVSEILNKVFPTVIAQDLSGMKYLKIFVNANNCIPAILGSSMQEVFADTAICRIAIALWKEGLDIVNKRSINLVSLPDFPLERLTQLSSLPLDKAAEVFSGIMTRLSKEPVYGSILQSIKRGKPSEIDYINGEFVRLAKENSLKSPLNEKMVEMVHAVEKAGRFFSKEELANAAKELMN